MKKTNSKKDKRILELRMSIYSLRHIQMVLADEGFDVPSLWYIKNRVDNAPDKKLLEDIQNYVKEAKRDKRNDNRT